MKKWILVILGWGMISNTTHAAEDSLYDFHWLDPDKSVYVLQNKTHQKEKRLTFDLGYLSNLTSEFQKTSGFMAGVGYNWHEEWGVEVFYIGYSNKNNDAYKNVKISSGVEPFIRRHKSTLAAGFVWSPFYGKVNTFNRIYYFDWSFGAGIAQVETQNNLRTSLAGPLVPTHFDTEKTTGGYAKTSLKFHVNENWNIGLGYQGTFYKGASPQSPNTKKWKLNSDVFLSVGFSY